jgi:DNA modification methylase
VDYKEIRNYGDSDLDLGRISDYSEFLEAFSVVFAGVYAVLKPGCYCCVVVMDLRKGSRFFPLHADLSVKMLDIGFVFDDIIIWDRKREYSNLRPLGQPSVFRINKVHE